MTAVAQDMTVLVADPAFAGKVPKAPQISVLTPHTAAQFDVHSPRANLFVVSTAADLEPVAKFVHDANNVHKLRALFVRSDFDCAWSVPLLERAGIRALRNTIVHTSAAVPTRVLKAWAWGAERTLIADAVSVGDRLLVRDCTLRTIEVAFGQVPALAGLPQAARPAFSVDPDGSFLHWTEGDVHVSLSEIRYALEPELRENVDLKRLASQKRFGLAVAGLRKERGLRQSDIGGVSSKQVHRIESGVVSPRLETVSKLAAALGLNTKDYLDAIASRLGPARDCA